MALALTAHWPPHPRAAWHSLTRTKTSLPMGTILASCACCLPLHAFEVWLMAKLSRCGRGDPPRATETTHQRACTSAVLQHSVMRAPNAIPQPLPLPPKKKFATLELSYQAMWSSRNLITGTRRKYRLKKQKKHNQAMSRLKKKNWRKYRLQKKGTRISE